MQASVCTLLFWSLISSLAAFTQYPLSSLWAIIVHRVRFAKHEYPIKDHRDSVIHWLHCLWRQISTLTLSSLLSFQNWVIILTPHYEVNDIQWGIIIPIGSGHTWLTCISSVPRFLRHVGRRSLSLRIYQLERCQQDTETNNSWMTF